MAAPEEVGEEWLVSGDVGLIVSVPVDDADL